MEEIKKEKKTDTRPLGKENFILMGVSVALIVIGFLLMGGGATTEETFNPDIFSTSPRPHSSQKTRLWSNGRKTPEKIL